MKRFVNVTLGLLLLLALCSCGSYESRIKGEWQGDGSFDLGAERLDGPPVPFNGAERWVFDGESAAIATVDGKDVELRYYATDDTLTLNDGGEVSWGVPYERKGDTLRIQRAEFTKVK